MDRTQQQQRPTPPEIFDLYAPIANWCASLYGAGPGDDVTARYYRALDKIVRHRDFDVDELRSVLVNGWVDFASTPEDQQEIENICWSSQAVRRFLEARGEAEKQVGPRVRQDNLAVH